MRKILHMILVLGMTGLVSGIALAFIYKATQEEIARNEKSRVDLALNTVLSGAHSFDAKSVGSLVYYVGGDSAGNTIGYGVLTEGNGYQGSIRLLFGVDAKLKAITGLVIFPNDETPGLGGKIVEKAFRKQFKGLAPYPKIDCVQGKEPEKPNEIQAITGATISSRSVVNIINNGMQTLLDEIQGSPQSPGITGATPDQG